MQFSVRYIAVSTQAVSQEVLDAGSASEIRDRLVSQGCVVLSIAKVAGGARSPKFDPTWWCRELRALLLSGMTVVEAIETLAVSARSRVRDDMHSQLLQALHEGQTLSRAMAKTGIFSAVLVAGVTASERTSTLPQALEDYLRYEKTLADLRKRVVSAAIYPGLVIAVGGLISLFLLLFVVPRFSRMYVDRSGHLSAATEAVVWLSQLLSTHFSLVVVGLAGLALAAILSLRTGWPKRVAGYVGENWRPLRTQLDHFRMAKLYQSLSLMFKGGYTLDEAIAVCEELGLGQRFKSGLQQARKQIWQGRGVARAFSETGMADLVSERLLSVGERTGEFDKVLQTIADRHAELFGNFVDSATRVLEPVLLLMVALFVGGMVVMMYMPIFDMAGSLGGAR